MLNHGSNSNNKKCYTVTKTKVPSYKYTETYIKVLLLTRDFVHPVFLIPSSTYYFDAPQRVGLVMLGLVLMALKLARVNAV
jgi:hypothetical protein